MKKTKFRWKFNLQAAEKLALIVVSAVAVSLIISITVMISKHTSEVLNRSSTEAINRTQVASKKVQNKLNDYVLITERASGSIQQKTTDTEFFTYLSSLKSDEEYSKFGLAAIRFFKYDSELSKDVVYSSDGVDKTAETQNDLALAYRKQENTKPTYLGININPMSEYSDDGEIQFYEFYAPIAKSNFADGISLYFSTQNFELYVGTDYQSKDAIYSTVCWDKGNIKCGGKDTNVASIIDEIWSLTGDKTPIDGLTNLLTHHESGTVFCKVNGIDHIISVQMDNEVFKDLAVVEFYECSVLAQSTNDFINSIVAIIIVFVAIICLTIGYLVFTHTRLQRKVANSENIDIKLGCLNRHGFEKESQSILSRQGGLYYAIIIIQLRHFKYLRESYGESEVNNLIEYLRLSCQKTCKIEEAYGHMGNGEFLMILHAKDREALIDRLKIHAFLASQYKGANKFDVSLKYGIYEHQNEEKATTAKMIDYANEALNAVVKATVENVDMQFNFYSDDLRKIRAINEDMELRQEGALRDGEFQVFYQAKYNLNLNKQDGAEALVRWYDPKTGEYNRPALFMPLFETNGFIEKLDKYVYTKVCEYIAYAIASGKDVYPISVNVSRITATQPDFIEFYTKTKKKYRIPNGALTIEFTESFAFENYDVLEDIVDRLHKAGFKCSIDDFGCGYSSYRILKELPMDEIKLDKFFIDYSEQPERVNYIFDSVISLAKNLKMKVTQEGVERQEDVELLKQHGCDVIQGYIYSKPVSLTDYMHFCENSRDHKL